jgi:predicted thioesterase
VACRDESDLIGERFHERAIIDAARFMSKMSKKQGVKGSV